MTRDDAAGSMDALVAEFGAFDVVIDATGRANVIEELPSPQLGEGPLLFNAI